MNAALKYKSAAESFKIVQREFDREEGGRKRFYQNSFSNKTPIIPSDIIVFSEFQIIFRWPQPLDVIDTVAPKNTLDACHLKIQVCAGCNHNKESWYNTMQRYIVRNAFCVHISSFLNIGKQISENGIGT